MANLSVSRLTHARADTRVKNSSICKNTDGQKALTNISFILNTSLKTQVGDLSRRVKDLCMYLKMYCSSTLFALLFICFFNKDYLFFRQGYSSQSTGYRQISALACVPREENRRKQILFFLLTLDNFMKGLMVLLKPMGKSKPHTKLCS